MGGTVGAKAAPATAALCKQRLMSVPNMESRPSTVSWVRAGPYTFSGVGSLLIVQCIETTLLREQMWSECRWVISMASSPSGSTPAATAASAPPPLVHHQRRGAGPPPALPARPGPVRVG